MTLARALITLVALVSLLFVLVRLLEPRLAFFPLGGESTTPRDFGVPFAPLTVPTSDGEELRAWHISPPLSTQHPSPGTLHPLVVYFHGNGGHLSMWAPILCAIARQGYSVLAFDYRGYGLSTGRPTERGLYRDVDAIVEHVWTHMNPPVRVIYWGRSLGVSMAAYAATRRPPAGLILESGFPDARSLFSLPSPMALLALFSTYRFPATEHLRTVKAPVLVIHGDADSIIPYELGRALYDRIDGPKQFFTVNGGDHNDAAPRNEASYWQTVRAFVDHLG